MSMIDESWIWNRRMGHLKFVHIMKVSKKEVLRDFLNIKNLVNSVCKHCQHVKQTKPNFKVKGHTTSQALEIVHIDLCGPTRTKSLQGEYYFMLLIDDYRRMT